MNICLVTPTYFPILGGTEEVIYNLANTLRDFGHCAIIVAPRFPTNECAAGQQFSGFEVRFPFNSSLGSVMLTQNRNCFREVVKADERYNFDVIHHFHVVPIGIAALLIRRKLRKPLITSLMGTDSYSVYPTLFYRLTRPLAAWVMGASDAVTSPSNDLAQRAYKTGCPRNIDIVPHGVNPERFDKNTARSRTRLRKSLGLTDDEKVVLNVSRLVASKNLEILIYAARIIVRTNPKTKFVIVGEGPEYSNLVRVASELRVASHFKFVGGVSPKIVPSYYGIADIMTLTSLYEAFGVVILEAMGASKPVVASNVGSTSEIVQDNVTGLLFPPRDSRALARSICRLLEDERLRTEMGNRARQIVNENYTWKHITNLYLALYKRLLAQPS